MHLQRRLTWEQAHFISVIVHESVLAPTCHYLHGKWYYVSVMSSRIPIHLRKQGQRHEPDMLVKKDPDKMLFWDAPRAGLGHFAPSLFLQAQG